MRPAIVLDNDARKLKHILAGDLASVILKIVCGANIDYGIYHCTDLGEITWWDFTNEIKKQGIRTIGIVNAIGSTIAREVDGGTYVHVGPEISVASTKAFTSQVIAMVMFGLTIAQAKGVKEAVIRPYIEEIAKLPDEISKVLEIARPEAEKPYFDQFEYAILREEWLGMREERK